METKTVFISYSWEGEEHMIWIKKLGADLLDKGVEVILDQWDNGFGNETTHFMEESVTKADRVLCILSPTYKEKCDNRTNGAGYEASIITSEILQHIPTTKFIPILKSGNWTNSSPIFLRGRWGVDMTNEEFYETKLQELIDDIFEINSKPRIRQRSNLD